MATHLERYTVPALAEALTQGDIFWRCPVANLRAISLDGQHKVPQGVVVPFVEPKVIVLSQTCDLEKRNKDGEYELRSAVVAPILTQQELELSNDQWKNVRSGKKYGMYVLPEYKGPQGITLPESAVALRLVCAVPRKWLEDLRNERCLRIDVLFREHLAMWFALTYMRIGLPEEGGPTNPVAP